MKLIPAWLTRNFRIKFGLFLLAVVLWFLVVSDEVTEQSITIPIVIDGVRDGKVIANNPPAEAEVRFQATGKQLLRMMYLEKPYLHIDMGTINYFYTFQPRTDMIVLPGGVEATPLYITAPDSIPVHLSESMVTKIAVKPDVTISTAPGYVVKGQASAEPDSVRVSGAKDVIQNTQFIYTEPIELNKIKRNTDLIASLVYPAESGIKIAPTEVNLKVQVEKIGQRKLIGVTVGVINIPRGRDVIVDPVSVDLFLNGGVSVIGAVEKEDVKAWADFRNLDIARGSKAAVLVEPIEGVEIIEVDPAEVRLIVRRH